MTKSIKKIVAVCIITAVMLSGCMFEKQGPNAGNENTHQVLIPADREYSNLTENNSASLPEKTEVSGEETTEGSGKNDTSFNVEEYLIAKKNEAAGIEDEEDVILDLFDTGDTDIQTDESIPENTDPDQNIAENDSLTGSDKLTEISESSSDNTENSLEENTGDQETQDGSDQTDTDTQSLTNIYANSTGTGPVNTIFNDTEHIFDYSTFHFDEEAFEELAPTVNMTFAELVEDNGDYSFPEGYPVAGTYRVVVDLYHQVVMVFTQDENGKYTVPVRYMLCSSGAESSPSPLGTFKMRSYRVRFGLFRNTESYAQYWSLISGRIYFHTILYTEHSGSSYTDSYKDLGSPASHGCIRLTVPDARWIWYHCAPGTVVEIRKGSKKEKEIGKVRDRLILADYPEKRMKLKSEKIPMTDNWKVEDIPHDVEFVQGSQE